MWVYASDLAHTAPAAPGSLIYVRDNRGKDLGSALYSSASQIALRMIAAESVRDEAELLTLLRQRVRAAVEYRKQLGLLRDPASNACRILYSEADGLPGIIADRYHSILSLQTLTQAMDRHEIKQAIVEELQAQLLECGIESVVERVDARIRELEQLPASSGGVLAGTETATQYSLNNVRFHYDALAGQKTGAFLDQRENYAAAAHYARGEALDAFCYQGGFALHLARVCKSVTAIDSSRPALEVAEQNEALNADTGIPPVEWMEANAFDLLKDYSAAGRQYDTIVLDPPAFAKSKRTLDAAVRGYKELNLRALKMLRPGGALITCSCSYHLSDQEFLQMLTSAASDAHKRLFVVESRTQAKDHPIVPAMPETKYLKCLICSVRN